MKGKLAFLLGAAVGYVLGTRAGRERYEQIKRGALRVWNTGPVQRGVESVRGAVDERAEDVKQTVRKLGSQLLGKLSEQAAGRPPAEKSEAEKSSAETPAAADERSSSSDPANQAST